MEHIIKSNTPGWSAGKVKGFYGKELIHRKNGEVKLVKVDPLATYPEHKHPHKTEYAHVIQGNPVFVIDDQRYTSEPGDFFIFPVNTKHAIINDTTVEGLLLVGLIDE